MSRAAEIAAAQSLAATLRANAEWYRRNGMPEKADDADDHARWWDKRVEIWTEIFEEKAA